MSKHRPPEPPVARPVPAPIPAAPVPIPSVQVPIGTCIGKVIICPSCRKNSYVTDARGARTATQVISSVFWVMTVCEGYCGKVLRPREELVTLLTDSQPNPVMKPLGAVVGRRILCPNQVSRPDGSSYQCAKEARASWTIDEAHTVTCPDCGARHYPGELAVEVVG